MRTRTVFVALLAVGLPWIAACGGIDFSAGSYSVIRIASSAASLSGDCNNDPNHTTTFDSGASIILYGVTGEPTDTLYLDGGAGVLEGSQKDDGSFTFTGKEVDVQDQGPITITEIKTTTVKFTVDGTSVKGTAVEVDDVQCAGTGCQGNDSFKCTKTNGFDGVQIPSADTAP